VLASVCFTWKKIANLKVTIFGPAANSRQHRSSGGSVGFGRVRLGRFVVCASLEKSSQRGASFEL
jgi:hypothetical protein